MITFVSSIGEIVIGFLITYLYIENKIPKKGTEIISIGAASIVMGSLVAYSRAYTHVSVPVVLICTLLTSLILWFIKRDIFLYALSIVWSYYSFLSVMQVFYVYWFIGQEKMVEGMYWGFFINVREPIRQFTYFYSLFITTFLLWLIWKILRRKEVEIKDYKTVLMGFCGAMTVLFIYNWNFLRDLSVAAKAIEGVRFVTFLTTAVIILLLTVAFLRTKKIEKDNAMLQLRDEIVKIRYQELEEAVLKNRHLVHDINNHLIILQEYAKAEENEKIDRYIEAIRSQYEVTSQKRWTQNAVMDFILNQKKMEAEHKNISFEIKSEQGIRMPITESEICVVFGNLLDNAIEASEKVDSDPQWIKVDIGKQSEMIFVKIQNNYDIEPIIKNGEYLTTKENKSAHGYGIKSVKRIIKNCDGILKFEVENNIFSVRILFPTGGKGEMQ